MSIEPKIFKYIQQHKESNNLLELLNTEYGLQIIENKDEGLIIVKYNKKYSKMDDELVRECRSIILDYNYNIVCFSPPKSLDIETFNKKTKNWQRDVIIQPFLDGTMINCFYFNNKWYTATRSSVDGKNSYYSNRSFNVLFEQTLTYNRMNLGDLDPKFCYSFVLNHPDNRIVVSDTFPTLTLVYVYKIRTRGKTIECRSLSEFRHKFKLVNTLRNFSSYEEVENYIKELEFRKREDIIQGFVFRYKNYRSKIRHPMYSEIKQLRGNNPDMIYSYLSIEKKRRIRRFLEYYPEYTSDFKQFRNLVNYSISDIYKYYHKCYIQKNMAVRDIPKIYKKHCIELHDHFKYKLIPNNFVSKDVIRKYWKQVSINDKRDILTNNSLET